MSTKRRLALLSSLAATPVFAAPFLAIGDNAELFLTARAEVRSDDNLFFDNANEEDDVVFTVTPGAELIFGKNSLTRGSVSYAHSFVSYADNDDLNENLANLRAKVTHEGAKLKVDANGSFVERFQANRDAAGTGTLVRSDRTDLGLNGELIVTDKSKVGTGVQYASTDYKSAGFTDREEITIPVNYYFAIRPKLDLSVGVFYRETDVDVGADTEDYGINVGARGEFTPKLIGSFKVGYTHREYDVAGVGDDSLFGVDAGLTYLYSPKTQFTLNLSNDFNTAAGGVGQEIASIDLGVRTQLNAAWSAYGSVGYQQIEYSVGGREDDYVTASVGVSYLVNHYLSLGASYTYLDNSNNQAGLGEFTSNIFSLSASLRY